MLIMCDAELGVLQERDGIYGDGQNTYTGRRFPGMGRGR